MKSFIQKSTLGALDQALLSAFSLLLGMAFIRLASKSEYASYSLLMTGILLFQSIQNALVNSPSATIFPAQSSFESKRAVFAAGLSIQIFFSSVIFVLGLVFSAWTLFADNPSIEVFGIAMAVLATLGVLLREYVRGVFYLRNSAGAALGSDTLYVLLAALAIVLMVSITAFTSTVVMGCIGFAGLTSGCIAAIRLGAVPNLIRYSQRWAMNKLLDCAKWALPSVVVSWTYANAFLYVVSLFLGDTTVADVSASRLLLVPISLIVIGWTSVFRPKASRLFADSDVAAIERTAKTASITFVVIVAIYGSALFVAFPILNQYLLGDKYSGLAPLVVAWTGFFLVTSVRSIWMAAMLSAKESFKPLFHYGWITLLIAIPCVLAACYSGPPYLVVVALTFAETVLTAMIFFHGWPALKRLIPPQGALTIDLHYPPQLKVLVVDTLSSGNDFGVELPMALDPLVNLTVFTIKGTRLQSGDCRHIIAAFPEYWGTRNKASKLIDQLRATWRLALELIKHRKGVVHVQFFRSPAFEIPLYFILRPLLSRLVYTAHNALPHEQHFWHPFAFRLWYSIIDHVHVLSHNTAEILISRFGIQPARITHAPIGSYGRFLHDHPPTLSCDTRTKLKLAPGEKMVLYFGLIRAYKGVDRLIDATSHLLGENVRVVIAGGCSEPLLGQLRSRIADSSAKDKILFLHGFVTNQDLSDYLAAADIIVFPYQHIYQSGAVLLAMTYGKPIVVSDLDGFKEYVQHGLTGWISNTSSPEEFATDIKTLLADPDLAKKIGDRAQDACANEFSWQRTAKTITTKVYEGK